MTKTRSPGTGVLPSEYTDLETYTKTINGRLSLVFSKDENEYIEISRCFFNGIRREMTVEFEALRSVILSVISDFSEESISGSEGKNALSEKLLNEMNAKLESLKEFPGIEGVYFTSFVVQ